MNVITYQASTPEYIDVGRANGTDIRVRNPGPPSPTSLLIHGSHAHDTRIIMSNATLHCVSKRRVINFRIDCMVPMAMMAFVTTKTVVMMNFKQITIFVVKMMMVVIIGCLQCLAEIKAGCFG
jgi:hypothetical protein